MMKQIKVLNDYEQEILELRLRLEEAEETLRAIRDGEIDGLIVSGSQGDQVFTLVGTDHTYRRLIEEMNEGTLTLAPDGVVLYCNRSFAAMLKTPQPRIIGSPFFDLIYPSDQYNFLVELARSDGIIRGEIALLRGDGTLLPVHFSINPMWVEGVQSFSLVITDLTEMKERARELRINK